MTPPDTDVAALESVVTTAEYVDRRATDEPTSVAVVDDGRALTWADVKRESDSIARGLRERLAPGSVVFEQLYNCAELYLLRLACEKAQLRLLTVPKTFRANELQPLFDATRPELALVPGTHRGFDYLDLVRGLDADSLETTLTLDGTGDGTFRSLYADGASIDATSLDPEMISQLCVTSGSSGTPTCVEVPVASRVRTGIVQAQRFGIDDADTVGVVTPLVSGTPDALAYYGGPATGVTVRVMRRFEVSELYEKVTDDVSVLLAVPTVTKKLLAYAQDEGYTPANTSLHAIVNYGDALSPSVGETVESTFDCTINQGFGDHEVGGISATSDDDPLQYRLGTVGRPLPGNEIRILTDEGTIADPGTEDATGNILMKGLHQFGRPVLGEVETVDGYLKVDVVVEFDSEGRIVLRGRQRNKIIRGGRNIYPEEIEGFLESHPDVEQAVVVGVPDEEFGERPCAFVVPLSETAPLSRGDLSAYLASEHGIARFKHPEQVVVTDSLPMVSAGHKVDRAALVEQLASNGPD